jgi:hypothetical protein
MARLHARSAIPLLDRVVRTSVDPLHGADISLAIGPRVNSHALRSGSGFKQQLQQIEAQVADHLLGIKTFHIADVQKAIDVLLVIKTTLHPLNAPMKHGGSP